MPDKTADALERILSLSTSAVASGGNAERGPARASARVPLNDSLQLGREPSPELQSSLFFDFGESVHDVATAPGVRPRHDSTVRARRAALRARMQHVVTQHLAADLQPEGPCGNCHPRLGAAGAAAAAGASGR